MNGLSVDSGLVGRQSTSLVRAENSDTSELLDGGDTGDDDLVLSKLLSTNGKSDRQDSWHGNWNTTDQEYKNVVQTMTVFVAETSIENKDLGDDENTKGDRAEGTDLSQDLLQVTSRVIVLADEGTAPSKKVLVPVQITTPWASPCLQVELLMKSQTVLLKDVKTPYEKH